MGGRTQNLGGGGKGKTLSGMTKGNLRLISAGLGGGGGTVWGEAEAGLIDAQSMQMAWPLPVLNFL